MEQWKLHYKPRKWQTAAFEKWRSTRRGVVRVVTGGGKTVFAEICLLEFLSEESSGQALIIVPTVFLLDQWVIALQEELNVQADEIGLLSGQEKPSGEERIIVAVINSARNFSEAFTRGRTVFLIVDECHRAGSPANAGALQGEFSATLGLSATPEREYDEGFETFIVPRLGPVIYDYDYRAAARDGVIAKFALVNVHVEMLPDEARQYQRLSRQIAREMRRGGKDVLDDEKLKRLLQIRATVSANATMRIPVSVKLIEMNKGQRAIVFHERIDSADTILALLIEHGHRATIYHSRVGPAIRRDNLRLFRRGMFDVLVCCRALDEGMNVPETTVAVIASSTASQRQRIQRLGRILRPATGKDFAIVFTLFASDPEQKRLREEARELEDITSVTWQTGRVRSDA